MSKVELSPGLLAALALTAVHVEPVVTISVSPLSPFVKAKSPRIGDPVLIKIKRNRRRNKLAAQSRKRNRR